MNMQEITPEFLRPRLLRRQNDSHKHDYGRLLVIAGCETMPGAALLATGAALRSGRDVKGALIGTGVCASHGMERTHLDGIAATLKLLYLYLCGED